MMNTKDYPRVTLRDFLEITIMWHCSGDIPMDRPSMTAFIESDQFAEYLMSVQYWCGQFGLEPPSKSSIVVTLYQLLDDPAYCK